MPSMLPKLDTLSVHEQLLLYSLASLLQDPTLTTTTTPKLVKRYNHYCDELEVRSRRGTTLYSYLIDFETLNLITRVPSPGLPARLSLTEEFSPYDILGVLESVVEDLERKIPTKEKISEP